MWCAEGIPRRREPPAPWNWSDDTEMALSVLATLEASGRIDQDELARRFTTSFHEGRMYGPAMLHEYFPRVRAGEPWRRVAGSLFEGKGSFGNGGAMRVAPLGAWFADDLDRVVEQARLSAEVTPLPPGGDSGGDRGGTRRGMGSPTPRVPRPSRARSLDRTHPPARAQRRGS